MAGVEQDILDQENGALRAPFLPAFFVMFGTYFSEFSKKLLNFVRQPYGGSYFVPIFGMGPPSVAAQHA